jgi:hypothetical protein
MRRSMIGHTSPPNYRIGAFTTCIVVAACMLMLMVAVPPAGAESDTPTVFVENYTISPQVLAPGDYGTLTVVIRNTAGAATLRESSGIISGGEFTTVKSVDIPTRIDTISLQGNGILVISSAYRQFGSIGPGQSAAVTFAFKAPAKEGIYFPEVWVDRKSVV